MAVRDHRESTLQHWVVPVGYALVVTMLTWMFLMLFART
jgi:hypothetical protein